MGRGTATRGRPERRSCLRPRGSTTAAPVACGGVLPAFGPRRNSSVSAADVERCSGQFLDGTAQSLVSRDVRDNGAGPPPPLEQAPDTEHDREPCKWS